jgi:hypothetical protein
MKLRTPLIGIAAAGMLFATASTAHAAHGLGDTTVALNGANEVGTAGDRNGSGKIHIDFFGPGGNAAPVAFPGEYYLCYDLVTRNIDDVTMAHIHEVDRDGNARTNPRKLNGPVVVDLLAEDSAFKDADGNVTQDADAATTTCVTGGAGVIEDILDDPREYYVNVHTADKPNGAIRGQLHTIS